MSESPNAWNRQAKEVERGSATKKAAPTTTPVPHPTKTSQPSDQKSQTGCRLLRREECTPTLTTSMQGGRLLQ